MSHISETIEKLNRELPPDTRLVAVSKFHPLESIIEAYSAGQRVFAESRPQELAAKVKELDGQKYGDIEWHFIGHLQTNKLKMVLPYVTMVQSVDSIRLLEAIDAWGVQNGRVIDVLLEYHIAQEEAKQGVTRGEILSVLFGHSTYNGVRFRGLMGMATFTDDEAAVRDDFRKIKELFDEISAFAGHNGDASSWDISKNADISDIAADGMPAEVQAGWMADGKVDGMVERIVKEMTEWMAEGRLSAFDQLSIGMTGDYRIAIEYGSTMVRIGTMIFGERQY
ncbi:MAG: YggS family pyridoxal phosphate-dependent enzyme [Bacteroidales bacterium]|nr:YggS family pyridoxal phosphate-dependent enzyme [Bacteroidales bacterium]